MESVTTALIGYAAWKWWQARQNNAQGAQDAGTYFDIPRGATPPYTADWNVPASFNAITENQDATAFDTSAWQWNTDYLPPEQYLYPSDDAMTTPSSGATVPDASGYTRGERNNNPGNIVKSSQAWQGKVAGSDSHFESFASPEYGIRALARVLRSYQRAGKVTLSQMINTYAPPVENNTSAYVAAVSRDTGIAPDSVPDLNNDNVLSSLAKAIIKHENGRVIYSDAQILTGVTMA